MASRGRSGDKSASVDDRKDDGSPDNSEADSNTDQTERRRSVRAKRDKPDYYDALDYESKRQKTPRSDKKKASGYGRGRVRRGSQHASLKKGRNYHHDDDDDLLVRPVSKNTKKKKSAGGGSSGGSAAASKREDNDDNSELTLDDIPQESAFQCAVSLAEINRRLGLVQWKP